MSTGLPYKICPECRTEYRMVATRCADCDVDLVHADNVTAEDAVAEAFPPASELECVRVAPIAWIHALSEALQQSGVPHRVESASVGDAPEGQRPEVFGGAPLFGLYLQSAHLTEARQIDGTIAVQILPDAAPPLADGEEDECPACGTVLAADATTCPDCGLDFG